MSNVNTIRLAESYLNIHLTREGPAGTPPSAGPFVTISREAGTGGSVIAEALAKRLNREPADRPWVVYSNNLIKEMLQTNRLPPHLACFLPEDSISRINASFGEIAGLHPDLWDLVEKTNDVIRQLARAGQAILLGRGANFATAGLPNGVHVRLAAPAPFRAARTARLLALVLPAATALNAQTEAARRRYVRTTFEADSADPSAYDFVLNLARLQPDEAVELVARVVLVRQQSAAGAPSAAAPHNCQ